MRCTRGTTLDPCRGSLLMPTVPGYGPVGPRYRGAFEDGERAPRRIRAAVRIERGGGLGPGSGIGGAGAGSGADPPAEAAVGAPRPPSSASGAADVGNPGAPGIAGVSDSLGAAVRLRSFCGPFPASGRSFGVSIFVDPETWEPFGIGGGWHYFRSGDFLLGLWSTLPATWLAQDAAGVPLPPPWRELWTFGPDHLWICRIGRTGGLGVPTGRFTEADFADECRRLRYPDDFGPERTLTFRTAGIAAPI